MNKLLRGFFTASAAVFLCSGCKGIPPENEAMSKALQNRNVTYSIVALDDKCFYLSLENQDLIFDYLMETDKNKEGGSYYTMEITTKKTDAMSFQWVQAVAYQNNTLKKIKNGDCDVMMDDAIHAFDSKKICTGAALQEARTYEAEIRKRLAAYGITPQDAFSYGRSYLKNNQDTALVNLDIMTRFKNIMPTNSSR